MFNGIQIGLIEVILIFTGGYLLRKKHSSLYTINSVIYYWLIFTIVTGLLWETAYVYNFNSVTNYSQQLIKNNETVWTNKYNISYILPWRLSKIFYAEYGAWADREYMNINDDWSRVIESTHAIFCGIFALFAVINKINFYHNEYLITLMISMGSQLMNSILYLAEYFIQTKEPYSINYNSNAFPTGILLSKRKFMWVNIFWFIMPSYVIFYYLMFYRNKYVICLFRSFFLIF